ncbi:MAG TPA: hypothetical protein VNP97_05480 [Microbacterium sp.]|nr:hypothetical protein [Microbacterium sp.]
MTPWQTPPKAPRSSKTNAARARHLHAAAQALIAACGKRSIPLVRRALRANVTLLVDAGGSIPAPRHPTRGAPAVAAALITVMSAHPDAVLTEHEVNALPGIVMRVGGRVVGVISLGLRGRGISAIWVVLNPDKLTHWNAP